MKLRTPAALVFAALFSLLPMHAQSTQTAPSKSAVPAAPATSAAPAAPAKVPASAAHKPLSEVAAAPGGGPGLVWVNTGSKVYHCPGTAYYGKTKAGKYMAEDAAKAEGDRANGGKVCSK